MVSPKDIDPRLFRASALATPGRGTDPLVEVRGGVANATTSFAVATVVDAQRRDDVVVWMQPANGGLFPPDLAENGVDLAALVVVHVPVREEPRSPRVRQAASHDVPKAAELLLRSGAIDLLVLDWRPGSPPRGAWLVRLQALAREHDTRVLLLTDAQQPLDAGCALVLRLEVERRRDQDAAGSFTIEAHVRRDKRNTTSPPSPIRRDGPAGLP